MLNFKHNFEYKSESSGSRNKENTKLELVAASATTTLTAASPILERKLPCPNGQSRLTSLNFIPAELLPNASSLLSTTGTADSLIAEPQFQELFAGIFAAQAQGVAEYTEQLALAMAAPGDVAQLQAAVFAQLSSNADGLNDRSIGLAFLIVFKIIAEVLKESGDWQDKLNEINAALNSFFIDFAAQIEASNSELNATKLADQLAAIRKSGLIGLVSAVATLVVGAILCLVPGCQVIGAFMVVDSLTRIAANAWMMANPEQVLADQGKNENRWVQAAKNGLFGLVLGKTADSAWGVALSIGMQFILDGGGFISTICNRALLTVSQLMLRGIYYVDSVAKLVGMTGSLVVEDDELFNGLSSGLAGLGLQQALQGTDEELAQILQVVLGFVCGFGVGFMQTAGISRIMPTPNVASELSSSVSGLPKFLKRLKLILQDPVKRQQLLQRFSLSADTLKSTNSAYLALFELGQAERRYLLEQNCKDSEQLELNSQFFIDIVENLGKIITELVERGGELSNDLVEGYKELENTIRSSLS